MRFTVVLRDYRKVGELTKAYSNLPDSYIKRSMEQIEYRTPLAFNYQRRRDGRTKIKFTMNRPWTVQSRTENPLGRKPKRLYVEPILLKDWIMFRGDRVEVLDGHDKGKQGIIVQLFQERNWAIVEGLNCRIKRMKEDTKDVPGVIVLEEKPLRVTDQLALVDPSDMLPCKVEWRFTEKGERVRVSIRSGRIIPMPLLAKETYDYKTPGTYRENEDKDTPAAEVEKGTFKPTLRTFEMDIAEKMNIKDDRIPHRTYWY